MLHLHNCFRCFAVRGRGTVAIAAFAMLGACSGDGGKKQGDRPPPQVGFVVARRQAVPVPVTLAGRVVAFETSEVRPQVNGVIRRRTFVEGSYVRAGQPLFVIDPSLYRAAVDQAAANLQSARASAAAARTLAARYKPLVAMQAISQQDYTDALAQSRVAQASVAQNLASLETARINLRYTTVPAPISGRIGRSLFTVGALASASQTDPLAVIQRTDPIYVDMQQSAADLVQLRRELAAGGIAPGSTSVRLKLDDGSDYAYPGVVKFSEVTVQQSAGTVTLRAQFANPKALLLPGMFVTAVFDQAVDPSVTLVPLPAVLHDFDGSAYVYLVGAGNKAVRRKIVTPRSFGQDAVVTQGLANGDRVILQGVNGLKNGAPIRPVAAAAPQVPKASSGKAGGEPGGAGGAG